MSVTLMRPFLASVVLAVGVVVVPTAVLVAPSAVHAAACGGFGPMAKNVAAHVAAVFQMHLLPTGKSDGRAGDGDINFVLSPTVAMDDRGTMRSITPTEHAKFFDTFWGSGYGGSDHWPRWIENIRRALRGDFTRSHSREHEVRSDDDLCNKCLRNYQPADPKDQCNRHYDGDIFRAGSSNDGIPPFVDRPECKAILSCEPCLFSLAMGDFAWEFYDDSSWFKEWYVALLTGGVSLAAYALWGDQTIGGGGTLAYYTPTAEISVPVIPYKNGSLRSHVYQILGITSGSATYLGDGINKQLAALGVQPYVSEDCHVRARPGGACGKKVWLTGPTVVEDIHWGQPEIHPIQSMVIERADKKTAVLYPRNGRPGTVLGESQEFGFAGFVDAREDTCYPEYYRTAGWNQFDIDLEAAHYAAFPEDEIAAAVTRANEGAQEDGKNFRYVAKPFCELHEQDMHPFPKFKLESVFRPNDKVFLNPGQRTGRCGKIGVTATVGGSLGGGAVWGRVTMGYKLVPYKLKVTAKMDNGKEMIARLPKEGSGTLACTPGQFCPPEGALHRWYRWKVEVSVVDEDGKTVVVSRSPYSLVFATDSGGSAAKARWFKQGEVFGVTSYVVWTAVRHDAPYDFKMTASTLIQADARSPSVQLSEDARFEAPRPRGNFDWKDVATLVPRDLSKPPTYSATAVPRITGLDEKVVPWRWRLAKSEIRVDWSKPRKRQSEPANDSPEDEDPRTSSTAFVAVCGPGTLNRAGWFQPWRFVKVDVVNAKDKGNSSAEGVDCLALPRQYPNITLGANEKAFIEIVVEDAKGVERAVARYLVSAPMLRVDVRRKASTISKLGKGGSSLKRFWTKCPVDGDKKSVNMEQALFAVGTRDKPIRISAIPETKLVAKPIEKGLKGSPFKASKFAAGAPFAFSWENVKYVDNRRGFPPETPNARAKSTYEECDTLVVPRKGGSGLFHDGFRADIVAKDRWGREWVGGYLESTLNPEDIRVPGDQLRAGVVDVTNILKGKGIVPRDLSIDPLPVDRRPKATPKTIVERFGRLAGGLVSALTVDNGRNATLLSVLNSFVGEVLGGREEAPKSKASLSRAAASTPNGNLARFQAAIKAMRKSPATTENSATRSR